MTAKAKIITGVNINDRNPIDTWLDNFDGKFAGRFLGYGALVYGVARLLTGCITPPVETAPLPRTSKALPTSTIEVSTPTSETVGQTATEMVIRTPIPEATATPVKTEINYEVSRFYEPEFVLEIEGNMNGIKIPMKIGLHKSVTDREVEPIKSIEVNTPDAADVYAKFFLTMCWQKFIEQNPEKSGISFAEYTKLVSEGKGNIILSAIDETVEQEQLTNLEFNPANGVSIIQVDMSLRLMNKLGLGSFYLGKGRYGELIITDGLYSADSIKIQKTGSNDGGWSDETRMGGDFSMEIGSILQVILINNSDNENFPDWHTWVYPILYQKMLAKRSPFFLIGQ